jgi:hypothetical protein
MSIKLSKPFINTVINNETDYLVDDAAIIDAMVDNEIEEEVNHNPWLWFFYEIYINTVNFCNKKTKA